MKCYLKKSLYFKRIFIPFIIISLFFPLFPSSYSNDILKVDLSKNIYSKNYLIFDRNSKNIIIENNGFKKVSIASTTKIMTCILAIENGDLNDTVTISRNASKINGSKLGLHAGSTIKLEDLLYGLMLRSGNDAAIAIAEHISGSLDNFIILMNNKAKELNLINTHFTSPHGLDNKEHYSSCYDLAILTDYALKNETFNKIVSTNFTNIYFNKQINSIHNTNNLLKEDNNFYGVKTGFTFNAGRCLVSAYKKGNIDIILITLNSNTNKERSKDTLLLKEYILNNYESKNLKQEIKQAFNLFLKNNKEEYIKSIPKSEISLSNEFNKLDYFLIKKDSILTYKINITPILSYKNINNETIGTFNIYENNNLIKTIDIKLISSPKKLDFNFYFFNLLKNMI